MVGPGSLKQVLNYDVAAALKKFDKVTKMATQELYMRDRIEIRSFASGDNCDNLLKEIERIYATRFGMLLRCLVYAQLTDQ